MNGECYNIAGIQQGVQAGKSPEGASEVPPPPAVHWLLKIAPLVAYSVLLSRPVVVQHHGHLTLTLDFQGQILKMLYLRNGRAD